MERITGSREYFGATLGLLLLAALLFPTMPRADWALIDDHELLSRLSPVAEHPQIAPAAGWWGTVRGLDWTRGRFRPLHWGVRLAGGALIGPHPSIWHLLTLALGLSAALLTYATARHLGLLPLSSWLVAAWLLAMPGVSMVWVRVGLQETVGTVLLALAGWAAVRGKARTFVAAALCAALTKESFALTLPALAALWLLAPGERARPRWTAVAVGIGAGATIGVTFLAGLTAGIQSDGGRYVGAGVSAVAGFAARNSAALVLLTGGVVPLAALGFLAGWHRWGREERAAWARWAALTLAFIGPQVLLYSRVGPMVERYLLPAGLVAALAGAAGLDRLWRRGVRPIAALGLALGVVALVVGGLGTHRDARSWVAATWQLRDLTAVVVAETPPGGVVTIVADPVRDYEPSVSLLYHLAYRRRADLEVRLMPMSIGGAYTAGETQGYDPAALTASLSGGAFHGHSEPSDGSCRPAAAVIALRPAPAVPCLAGAVVHLAR